MFLGEKLFSNEKNIKEKHLVLAVIKSVLTGFIRGKIETKAQFLAKRPVRGYWRPLQVTKFFSLIFIYGS